MRPADPAIDAEKLDAVGASTEGSLAVLGQPQGDPREDLAVAERGRRRKRIAFVGLDEAVVARAEGRQGAVEPGVAEEGSRLEVLGGEERASGSRGAVRDLLERAPFQAGEAVARRRKLLEQAAERERLLVDGHKLRKGDRLRCAHRVPGLPCCGAQVRRRF